MPTMCIVRPVPGVFVMGAVLHMRPVPARRGVIHVRGVCIGIWIARCIIHRIAYTVAMNDGVFHLLFKFFGPPVGRIERGCVVLVIVMVMLVHRLVEPFLRR
jgi:hypothetical protein